MLRWFLTLIQWTWLSIWAKLRKLTNDWLCTRAYGAGIEFKTDQLNAFVCKRQQKHSLIHTRHKTLWSSSRPTYCYCLGRLSARENQQTHIFPATVISVVTANWRSTVLHTMGIHSPLFAAAPHHSIRRAVNAAYRKFHILYLVLFYKATFKSSPPKNAEWYCGEILMLWSL